LATVPLVNGSASFTTSTLVAGSHSITAHYSGDASHPPSTSSPVALGVTRAPPTVTTDGASRFYKQPNPAFTASYSGFVNGEDSGDLGGTLGFSTTATVGSLPGLYAVTPFGLTSSNYSITFVDGSLSVLSPTLSVTGVSLVATEGASFSTIVATF